MALNSIFWVTRLVFGETEGLPMGASVHMLVNTCSAPKKQRFKALLSEYTSNFGDLLSITLSQDVLVPYPDSFPPSPSFLVN